MSIFVSNLTSKLYDFVTSKKSLGIEYKTGQFYLRKLDVYNFGHGNLLGNKVAEGWAIQHANKSTTIIEAGCANMRSLRVFKKHRR
jgi:hypothetical protein